MTYKNVYFDDENQKVRWTTTPSHKLSFSYEYIGTMTKTEFDILVEVLWELYEDNEISLEDFVKTFGDLRAFFDRIKEL